MHLTESWLDSLSIESIGEVFIRGVSKFDGWIEWDSWGMVGHNAGNNNRVKIKVSKLFYNFTLSI